MVIRRWMETDQREMFDLHILSMKDSDSYKGEGPWDDDMKDIPGYYLTDGGEFLVGVYDGRIVAMGAFHRLSADSAEIKRIRTHPEYQKKGCAKAIMDELEKRAVDSGVARLELVTTVTQKAAQALYAKCGFTETGRMRLMGYDCIAYEKTIGKLTEAG